MRLGTGGAERRWVVAPLAVLGSMVLATGLAHAQDPDKKEDSPSKETVPHAVDQGTMRFRPGRGLWLESADGQFGLGTRVRGQVRYSARSGGAGHQFQLRRARVVFAGHFFGRGHRFKLELAISPRDLGVSDNLMQSPSRSPLLDLYFDFDVGLGLTVRVGQYKLPSNRTRVISSGDLQLVDRSIINAEFTLDRDVGLDLRTKKLFGMDTLRAYAGVSIGRGRDSVGFDDLGLNYFVRVEALPMGPFDDYREVDFSRHETPKLSVGLAYAHQNRARGLRQLTSMIPEDGGRTSQHVTIADLIFKYRGFSAQAEGAYRRGRRRELGPTTGLIPILPRNGWGFMTQAGWLLPDLPLEVAGRFGMIRGISDSSLSDAHEVVGGVGWYFAEHPFKLQADLQRNFESSWNDGTTLFRIQLQASL